MLGFLPLGTQALGAVNLPSATVTTSPVYTANLELSGAGFAVALSDTLSGEGFTLNVNTGSSGAGTAIALGDTLSGTGHTLGANTASSGSGVALTLDTELTTQVD